MGKKAEQPQIQESQVESSRQLPWESCFSMGISAIKKGFSSRCVIIFILGVCVFLSAIFWLPPFHPIGSGSQGSASEREAPVQASFKLERPVSLLAEQTERLKYELFGELGMPNTQVSIISVNPIGTSNWTHVVFGVLPDPYNVPIPVVALSLLRSTLLELIFRTSDLLLTPSIFGQPTSFEIVKFPGGVTVIPQSASIFLRVQVLFNFTLNNSISQIKENVDQFKDQLKFGLLLKPDENVYISVTNLKGSTLAPPVIVQAAVLSDVGSRSLVPQRLKQLAQTITDSHAKNLGLDHVVFGKVKQIQLSSYLEHSMGASEGSPSPSPSPLPSPSPSPSPFPFPSPSPSSSPPSPFPAPSEGHLYPKPPISQNPAFVPSNAPTHLAGPHHPSPCAHCQASSPSAFPHAPTSRNGPEPPLPPCSPLPTVPTFRSPQHSPYYGPSISVVPSPTGNTDPPAPSGFPHAAVPPANKPPSPCSQYKPSSPQDQISRKALSPSMTAFSPSSSASSSCCKSYRGNIWLIGLLGLVMFQLLCGPH